MYWQFMCFLKYETKSKADMEPNFWLNNSLFASIAISFDEEDSDIFVSDLF